MKFLKNTMAIVALFGIGSVSAKLMKKTTQPVTQTQDMLENRINAYIDQVFNTNSDEMADTFLNNFDDYDAKDVCVYIQNLAQFVANEFPTARQLFKVKMKTFCDPDDNNKTKMRFIQECIDKSMTMPSVTTVSTRKMVTPKRNCPSGRCGLRNK